MSSAPSRALPVARVPRPIESDDAASAAAPRPPASLPSTSVSSASAAARRERAAAVVRARSGGGASSVCGDNASHVNARGSSAALRAIASRVD
jgi:hypothetical protein